MQDHAPDELRDSITEIARLTLDYGSLQDLVGRVTHLAVQAISGCDWAGLSLVTGSKVTTRASTDDLVDQVDAVQYDTGVGPCLQAIRDSAIYLVPSTEDDDRFSRWSGEAFSAGVASSLSVPLQTNGETLGALNLYSGHRDGFNESDEPLAQMLAEQVAVCLLNGQIYDQAARLSDQLQVALETRTMIGQATGILMEREGLSAQAAFANLKKVSQTSNVKLRKVAQAMLDHHHSMFAD